MLREFGKGDPTCGVHVEMAFVRNVLLVNLVCPHPLRAKPRTSFRFLLKDHEEAHLLDRSETNSD